MRGGTTHAVDATDDGARVILRKDDFARIVEHGRAWLPNECCGLVAGTMRTDETGRVEKVVERVFALTNVDRSPEHFTIDPVEQLAAIREARAAGLLMLGNFHSHPSTPARQSEEDKRLSYDHDASYLIVSFAQGLPDLRSFHFDGLTSIEEELVVIDQYSPR